MKYSQTILNSNEKMRFSIRHRTHFTYDQLAFDSTTRSGSSRVTPHQRTFGFRLEALPRAAVLEYTDAFGNLVNSLPVAEP